MSTKERYGTEVWNAICRLEDKLTPEQWGWHSAGEVGKEAGVSRNTARKYLDMLYENGNVRSIGMKNKGYYYQPKREGV